MEDLPQAGVRPPPDRCLGVSGGRIDGPEANVCWWDSKVLPNADGHVVVGDLGVETHIELIKRTHSIPSRMRDESDDLLVFKIIVVFSGVIEVIRGLVRSTQLLVLMAGTYFRVTYKSCGFSDGESDLPSGAC